MTASKPPSSNNTADAQFLAPQTHHPAGNGGTPVKKVSVFGFPYGGRFFEKEQVIAAIRCAESLFGAYARASEALGLGSQSIQWADLDNAADHARDALSEGHRDRIDAESVAQFHGVQLNGHGIVIQTETTDGDIEVTGSNIGEQHLELLLTSCGTLHVHDQDGNAMRLYFDMDQESLVAEPATSGCAQ